MPKLKKFSYIEYYTNKFFVLFISLIILLLISPYTLETASGQIFLSASMAITLFAAVYAIGTKNKVHFSSFAVFACMIVIADMVQTLYPSTSIDIAYLALSIVFQTTVVAALFTAVFKGGQITEDTIFGAMSLYLLIGVMFSNVYILIETLAPNSFLAEGVYSGTDAMNAYEFIYFSFTTLTTVGFGDVLPIRPVARSVVMLEQVTGVLYLATLVARLVGHFPKR